MRCETSCPQQMLGTGKTVSHGICMGKWIEGWDLCRLKGLKQGDYSITPDTQWIHFISKRRRLLNQWIPYSLLGTKPTQFNEFFEENLINNLAAVLALDNSRIRVVQIVNALGDSRRQRRDYDNEEMNIIIEIGDEPSHKIPYTPEEKYNVLNDGLVERCIKS